MKFAILSDIHANLEALRAVLDRIDQEGADRIVCLGDVVGYNADPSDCIRLLRERNALCVAGNHDRAVTGQITTEGFSSIAARAVGWTGRRLDAEDIGWLAGLPLKAEAGGQIVAVHGALHPDVGCEIVRLDNEERRRLSFEALAAHPSGARVCVFGHTHRQGVYEWRDGKERALSGDDIDLRRDALYLINPGTVGEPRGRDWRAAYLIFDSERHSVALRRVPYDRAAALAKTRRAGLAPRFSQVPAPIRWKLIQGMRALGIYDLAKRLTRPRSGGRIDAT
ncbi:metallophosphoesterase family protein [Azospirillum sp. SYSU D00513]|uniref:metallophosphoesterase family protein n=1 Tax=Azospirillum sp. SYSU D00513 TaxID=2812561 RepID=UPI001A96C56B|nr:metallophosphoesterase family protein [Azospirillum sp. SYSU D00513]